MKALFLFLLAATASFTLQAESEFPDSVVLHIAKDNVNCLYGLKNSQDSWVLKPTYTLIQVYYNDYRYFELTDGNLIGLLRIDGKHFIKPQFEDLHPLIYIDKYSNGNSKKYDFAFNDYFAVKIKGYWGLYCIQTQKLSIKAKYKSIYYSNSYYYNDGLKYAKVESASGFFGMVDSSREVIKPIYKDIYYIGKGLFEIRTGDSAYVINLKEKKITDTIYGGFRLSTVNNKSLIWAFQGKNYQAEMVDVYNLKGKKCFELRNNMFDVSQLNFACNELISIDCGNCRKVFNADGDWIITDSTWGLTLFSSDFYWYGSKKNKAAMIMYDAKEKKYGLLDAKANKIGNKKYDYLEVFYVSKFKRDSVISDEFLFIARQDSMYGIVDEEGNFVFPFIYDYIFIQDDYLIVSKERQLEFYHISDLLKSSPAYYSFNTNGIAFINSTLKYTYYDNRVTSYASFNNGLINSKYKLLVKPKYEIDQFINGSASIHNVYGEFGTVDEEGNIEWGRNNAYISTALMRDRFFWVESYNNKSGIQNDEGKLIVDTVWAAVADCNAESGLFWVKSSIPLPIEITDENEIEVDYSDEGDKKYGNWGLVNEKGQLVLDTVWDYPSMFIDNLAIVNAGSVSAVINTSANFILKPEFNYIKFIGQERFAFMKNSKYGMADYQGHILLSEQFDRFSTFYGNYAIAAINDSLCLINKEARMFWITDSLLHAGFSILDSIQFGSYSTDLEDDLNTINFDTIKVDKIIEDLSAFNSIANSKFRLLVKNRIGLSFIENDMLSDILSDEISLSASEPEVYYSSIYIEDERLFGYTHGYEENGTHFELLGINNLTVSLLRVDYTSGWQYYHEEFFHENYLINDSVLIVLELDDLFIDAYDEKLESALLKALKTIDNPNFDCKNPEFLLEANQENFSIEKEGLVFYFYKDVWLGESDVIKVVIPYAEIKSIIKKDGPLAEFL